MATIRICSVEGCNNLVNCRGWCRTHYMRWKTHGHPTFGGKPISVRGRGEKFFVEVVLTYTGTDCLIWPYTFTRSGYGRLYRNGYYTGAHRAACEAIHGPPPEGHFEAAHYCGERKCCNPRHVRWATCEENAADKFVHGREPLGEERWSAKMNEAQAREVLRLSRIKPYREIADKFGVSETTVRSIAKRETWRHL